MRGWIAKVSGRTAVWVDAAFGGGRADHRRHAVVGGLALAAAAIVLATSVWTMVASRRHAIQEAEREGANLARAFSSQAARSLGEASRVLDAVARSTAERGGPRVADEAALSRMLQAETRSAPQMGGALLVDAAGFVVAGSQELPEGRVSVRDRPYFARHSSDPSTAMLIGGLVESRLTGRAFVSVTRRIAGADGAFLGVVLSGIRPEYFAELHRTVDLGGDGFVELIDERGAVLAASVEGRGGPGRLSIAQKIERRGGVATARVEHEGDDYFVAVSPVESFPLRIVVGIDAESALAGWRSQVRDQIGMTLVAAVVLVALGVGVWRRSARLAASESDARDQVATLRSIIESMGDGVAVVNARGELIVLNQAAAWVAGKGFDAVGAPGRAARLGMYPAGGDKPLDDDATPMARALGGESVDNLELLIRNSRTPQGVHISVNARPIRDPQGAITGAVAVYRDTTRAKSNERQLAEANRMESIGQLTGGIAHDFNNILTVILGNAELLTELGEGDPAVQPAAQAIVSAAERGAELTRHLTAFARQQSLEPTATNVNDLVVEMGSLLRAALGASIEIESMLAPDLDAATIDVAQLQTALLNLALNARDAMPDGGRLTIETGNATLDETYAAAHGHVRPGRYVMLAVRDTGVGIAPEIRSRLFEPFFTTKGVGKGSGLGLSMVYGFMRQSGGHVALDSEVGRGTTVRLYLPRAEGESPRRPVAADSETPRASRAETILAVEDDPLVREFVAGQLRALGYVPLPVATAAEALDMLEAHPEIALLFTDVILPGGLNGRQLAEEVRRRRPGLPVLFTSGHTENVFGKDGRPGAGMMLLAKPYRQADLARRIRESLDKVPQMVAGRGA